MSAQETERGMSFSDEREAVVVHYDIELDDAELDPYQFRAYQRIARRCAGAKAGQCFESLEAMAQGCKMSRPTLVRAIKTLIQRRMIRRLSRQGMTSYYALTDKKSWLPASESQPVKAKQPGKPQNHVGGEPGKPQSQGVVNERTGGWFTDLPGGGSVVSTKNTHEENTGKRESARALSLAVTPFTSETEPTTDAELKAEKLFPVIHGGCTLPPKLDRKIERRIYNCIDNLVLGNFTVEEVQAFIADWRLNKSIALTPERVASDIGEWRRLRTPAPVLNLPPKPDTKGMSVGEERKALSAWFQACQQLKQQTGVAA